MQPLTYRGSVERKPEIGLTANQEKASRQIVPIQLLFMSSGQGVKQPMDPLARRFFFHLLAVAGMGIAFPVASEVPHSFKSGQAAKASEVNENFRDMDQRIGSLKERYDLAIKNDLAINVDCNVDPQALASAIAEGYQAITVTDGACNGDLRISRQSVRITGLGTATIDTISHGTGEAIWIENSSYVEFQNIDIRGQVYLTLNGVVKMTNVAIDCTGQLRGLYGGMSTAWLTDTRISGCPSIFMFENSHVVLDGPGNEIEGNASKPAMRIGQNSSVAANDDISIKMTLLSGEDTDAISLGPMSNANFRGGIIEGSIKVHSSHLSMTGMDLQDSGNGIKRRFDISDNSTVGIHNVDLSDTNLTISRSSSMTLSELGTFSHHDLDINVNESQMSLYGSLLGIVRINANHSSSVHLNGDETATNDAVLSADNFSFIGAHSGTTISNANSVTCGFTSRIFINGTDFCP